MVVSDTGALITLERIDGGFDFIRKLYTKIIIPQQVLDELSEGKQYKGNYLDFYNVKDLFEIRHSELRSELLDSNLGDGEKYAISLSIEYNLPLLIEDREAKAFAIGKSIPVSGIAGRVLKAYKNNIIDKSKSETLLESMYESKRINARLYSLLLDRINVLK